MYSYIERGHRAYAEGRLLVAILLIAVLMAEGLLFFGRPAAGFIFYISLVIICSLGPIWSAAEITFFQAFALIAVFRVVDIGFPELFAFPWSRTLLIYFPILVASVVVLYQSETLELRFNPRALVTLPLILLLAGGMAVAEFSILRPTSLILERNLWQVGLFVLSFGIMIGVTEEVLFRGILQEGISRELGSFSGIFISAVVFGAFHSAYGQAPVVAVAAVFGFIYGLLYYFSEDITTVAVLHVTVNMLLFGLLPLYPELTAWPLI